MPCKAQWPGRVNIDAFIVQHFYCGLWPQERNTVEHGQLSVCVPIRWSAHRNWLAVQVRTHRTECVSCIRTSRVLCQWKWNCKFGADEVTQLWCSRQLTPASFDMEHAIPLHPRLLLASIPSLQKWGSKTISNIPGQEQCWRKMTKLKKCVKLRLKHMFHGKCLYPTRMCHLICFAQNECVTIAAFSCWGTQPSGSLSRN